MCSLLFALYSIIRTVGSAEGTHVRKNSNKFGYSLTYPYLCTQRNAGYYHMKEMKKSKSKLARRITWRVVLIMVVFNVLILGVIVKYAFNLSLVNSAMRGQYVMDAPQQLTETMNGAVHQFVGDTEQSDDLTMLAIQYKKSETL